VELQAAYSQFQERHAEVLAVAYQNVDRAQQMAGLIQASYPILADVDHAVTSAYGVFNLLGDDVATPAVFIVQPTGEISWSNVSTDPNVRPNAAEILSHLSP
jgi:peroxiredoxin